MELSYTVFYRFPIWPFWRKIKNVTYDFLQYDQHMNVIPGVRILLQSGGSRIELPTRLIIKFGPERNISIEQNKQKEVAAGGKGS